MTGLNSANAVVASQVPAPGELNVDHIAHFVPYVDSASAALEQLGFTLTPFSEHSHRSEPGGPLVPAGSGNRCVMFEHGFVEILTPTSDTLIATQLRTAIKRYVGVHLIAFGTAAAESDHARIEKAGFNPLPAVALQRQIGTETGESTARFTVVRVPPGTMAEGRIQYCQHHTPELLWQPRWTGHANHAVGLSGVILRVANAQETARRYARYTGLLAQVSGSVWRIATPRGYLIFTDRDTLHRRFDITPPTLPWIAGTVLESDNITATGEFLRRSGIAVHVLGSHRLLVKLPPAVGGIMIFEPRKSGVLNFD